MSSAVSQRSPLGTSAKTVSGVSKWGSKQFRTRTRKPRPDADVSRLRRFRLQSQAAELLPKERVAACLRKLSPVAACVEVQYASASGSAHFRGLQTCASVWHCPVCAAKISERRRLELERVIKKHITAGGSVYMATYTIRHGKYDDLATLLTRFLAARRRAKQGRRGKRLRDDFGIFGTISVLEVTWSEGNGWHPHIHELVLCALPELDVDAYEQEARAAWSDAAAKEGLSMNEHGFKLDRTYGAVQDYIVKFGHEPAKDSTTWGPETEMTKGHIKQARVNEHYTPFALLVAIEAGRDDLKPIFVEYAKWFKGRKQLTYSPGIKSFYEEEEKTDEELAAEVQEEAITLVSLDRSQWSAVIGNDIRGELLEVARSGDVGLVLSFLAEFGIQCSGGQENE